MRQLKELKRKELEELQEKEKREKEFKERGEFEEVLPKKKCLASNGNQLKLSSMLVPQGLKKFDDTSTPLSLMPEEELYMKNCTRSLIGQSNLDQNMRSNSIQGEDDAYMREHGKNHPRSLCKVEEEAPRGKDSIFYLSKMKAYKGSLEGNEVDLLGKNKFGFDDGSIPKPPLGHSKKCKSAFSIVPLPWRYGMISKKELRNLMALLLFN
ncbi:hypothetical protein CR513_20727, partial [Mucuna pruriens]